MTDPNKVDRGLQTGIGVGTGIASAVNPIAGAAVGAIGGLSLLIRNRRRRRNAIQNIQGERNAQMDRAFSQIASQGARPGVAPGLALRNASAQLRELNSQITPSVLAAQENARTRFDAERNQLIGSTLSSIGTGLAQGISATQGAQSQAGEVPSKINAGFSGASGAANVPQQNDMGVQLRLPQAAQPTLGRAELEPLDTSLQPTNIIQDPNFQLPTPELLAETSAIAETRANLAEAQAREAEAAARQLQAEQTANQVMSQVDTEGIRQALQESPRLPRITEEGAGLPPEARPAEQVEGQEQEINREQLLLAGLSPETREPLTFESSMDLFRNGSLSRDELRDVVVNLNNGRLTPEELAQLLNRALGATNGEQR